MNLAKFGSSMVGRTLFLMLLMVVSVASAQTFSGNELAAAESVVSGFIAVGVAVTVIMVVFALGKRGANKV